MALQILGRLFRIELHRGVEEAEEGDAGAVEDQIERRAMLEQGRHGDQPVARSLGRSLRAGHLQDGQRHQQQRRGEDRRDHAGGVDLQRQMAALLLHRPARRLALGILDQHAPLRPLHEADAEDQSGGDQDDAGDHQRVHRAGAAALEQLRERRRQLGDDPGHDDQRHAIADAAAGDLLADPHQEQGAADQADRRRDAEHHARLDDRAIAWLAPRPSRPTAMK